MNLSCSRRCAAALAAALPVLALAAGERGPAPAAGCLDARQMVEVRQAAPERLAVATADGGRFRVHFDGACPGLADRADTVLLAREGWVCGRGNEYARAGDTLCAIRAVEPIDAAAYAADARASQRTPDGTTVLDTVTVRGEARRGFAGSPNHCLNPRWMRGWSEDAGGLRVEMRARRAGGNRFYRVELGAPCPELANAASVRLLSGPGIGMVCGNAGDRVLVQADAFRAFDPTGIERNAFATTGSDLTEALARHGCPIVAVYPLSDGEP